MSKPITFEELTERLAEPTDTLILFHRNPDADAVGSAFALRQVLCDLGARAFCVCEGEIPARLRFLTDGAQESVLWESLPADFRPARVIAVDTASPAQLGSLAEVYGDRIDLAVDHHGIGTPFAKESYIRPDAAATGEILFDVVKHLATEEKIPITEALCVDLYAAVSGDTGGFRYSNVTPETHLRAAELLRFGIDAAEINHRLFETKSRKQMRAEAAGLSNLNLFFDGRVAIITFPYALKAALELSDEHLETLVDIARSLEGVAVAIAVRQPATEGKFRVSMRSSCDFDVSALCKKFDGGGHARAAGCTMTATDAAEAMQKIVDAIDESALPPLPERTAVESD